jgi:murein DD-endopeptidase MepM/ murein hydrolase activator NlpD
MSLSIKDRLQTIAVTATIVSALWIVAGSIYLGQDPGAGAEDAPAPTESGAAPSATATFAESAGAPPRDALEISEPDRARTANLMIPVLGVSANELVDTFSTERGGGERLHEAIDIMAPEGTSVVAAAPGTVERLFRSEAGGNTIYVRSNDRESIHYYAHLAEYARGLREGQRVRRGQRLGNVGTTGNADVEEPHLHFAILRTFPQAEWWEPSAALNPYPLLTGR